MSSARTERARTDVDPESLVTALEAAGWTRAGGHPGLYTRMRWPHRVQSRTAPAWLLIPLNQAAPDFADLLSAALAELTFAAHRGEAAAKALRIVRSALRRLPPVNASAPSPPLERPGLT